MEIRKNVDFIDEVMIRANTSFTVTLLLAPAKQVKQNGTSLKPGFVQIGNNLQLSLGSGKYSFKYPASS
jgi:hypothetical protein